MCLISINKNKKVLRLLRLKFLVNVYANMSGRVSDGSLVFLYKYLTAIRYDRFISSLFLNIHTFRSYLGVITFSLLKYGIFCSVSVHKFLFRATRILMS